LNDAILANHDDASIPEIAKLRAQNLLKYEIDSAKKTPEQLKHNARFTFGNKQESMNDYYYKSSNRESFITIDQLKENGDLFIGNDITSFLPRLAINKNEIKDTFNIIENTSYMINDTQFTLYARIDDYDYANSTSDYDITIDYGMIESKYDALPNRDDFMVWYSECEEAEEENPMFASNEEEENKNPLTYHMLLTNEYIEE
jgi:hypothetical protein